MSKLAHKEIQDQLIDALTELIEWREVNAAALSAAHPQLNHNARLQNLRRLRQYLVHYDVHTSGARRIRLGDVLLILRRKSHERASDE